MKLSLIETASFFPTARKKLMRAELKFRNIDGTLFDFL